MSGIRVARQAADHRIITKANRPEEEIAGNEYHGGDDQPQQPRGETSSLIGHRAIVV